jgi:hypothetical protein
MARHWHFLGVPFWVGNGATFVLLLVATDQWKRRRGGTFPRGE